MVTPTFMKSKVLVWGVMSLRQGSGVVIKTGQYSFSNNLVTKLTIYVYIRYIKPEVCVK